MTYETLKLKNGQILKIIQDSHGESPREWDNMGKMVCFHGRYNLGDKHNLRAENFSSFQEMVESVIDNGVYLPLYLYDHGAITMSTSPFACRWDSGQVGFIYMTAQDIRRGYGKATAGNREKALKMLQAEVETYNQYLIGDVFGFELIEVKTCNLGCEHEEVIDSCWGFYGTDFASNGLFEHAGIKQQDVA